MQTALELRGKLPAVVALEQPPGKPAIQEIPGKPWQRAGLALRSGRDPIELQQGQREGRGDRRLVRIRFQRQAPRIEPAEQLIDGLSQGVDLLVAVGTHASDATAETGWFTSAKVPISCPRTSSKIAYFPR